MLISGKFQYLVEFKNTPYQDWLNKVRLSAASVSTQYSNIITEVPCFSQFGLNQGE